MRQLLVLIFTIVLTMGCISITCAQAPPNDNCSNALDIATGNGFGYGKFISKKVNLKNAGRQSGETVDSLLLNVGNDKKTVWYRFETKTRRSVSIQLRQKDSGIAQNAVGLSVYRSNACVPNRGLISTYLPSISKFGASASTCLPAGIYLIQVCANKSAADSIWLELTLDIPSPNDYDKPKDAYSFGTLSNTVTSNVTFHAGCQSVDSSGEKCNALGADYSESAWLTFTTPSYLDIANIGISVTDVNKGVDTLNIGYNLYEGDAKSNSNKLSLVDGCRVFQNICYEYNQYFYCDANFNQTYKCKLKPNTTYSIQLFFHKDADYTLDVNANVEGQKPGMAYDVKNLPSAYQLGTLNNGSVRVVDNLGCNSIIPAGTCASTYNGAYVDTFVRGIINGVKQVQIDTFDLNSWFTFTIPSTGSVNFNILTYNSYLQCGYILRVFKGDATKSCAITLLYKYRDYSNNYNLCIDAGVYSVQLLAIKDFHKPRVSCTYSNLGKIFDCTVNFRPYVTQKSAVHYKTSLAENLGDITNRVASGFSTSIDYFGSTKDSFSIKGYKVYGNFVFRQFYISKPFYLKIAPTKGYIQGGYDVFLKGKATDGIDSLSLLDNVYGGFENYWDSSITGKGCKALPPGWYSILTYRDNNCNDDRVYESILSIKSFNPCTQFDKPYKAGVFNNGQPLTFGPKYNGIQNPMYKKTYTAPSQCPICTDTPFIPFPQMCNTYGYTKPRRVSYYVFALKKESSLMINQVTYNDYGYLYKFDVRKDSAHLTDSSYIIRTCERPSQYCKLQAGVYTYVSYSVFTTDYQPTIIVDTVGYSKYDFAANAYDFGLVPMNNVVLNSLREVVYCTTSAHYKDPQFDGKTLFEAGEYSVPVKMPVNFVTSSIAPVRNMWYTFLLPGSGTCQFDVNPFPNISTDRFYYQAYLFKSNRGAIPFATLKSSGKVDSTLVQGLQTIPLSSVSPYFNNWQFTKSGCDTVRYYMLVQYTSYYSDYLNTAYTSDIHYNGIAYDNAGDYCSNAKLISLNGAGTASEAVTVNCHSIGESFGEDGSNMACLLSDSLGKSKSSWFRVHINNAGKYDLSFSLTNNTNATGTAIRYRVLYGSCGAMTPGPCLGNAYSSFTLDCMSEGDYYVQVVMPASAIGTVQLNAKALATKFPVCKPFNLLQPQANFSTKGGCNGEPISFINLSTQGANIKYKWNLGDGNFSFVKNPIHKFSVSQAITLFTIKLSVTDTVSKLSDTISLGVYVYRDPVVADAGNDTIVPCGSVFHLHATCNYPGATFIWSPGNMVDNPYSPNPRVNPTYRTVYRVNVHAENCDISDSIVVKTDNGVKISGKPFICGNEPITISGPPGFDVYYWSTYDRTQSITITKPGKYWVTAYHNNGFCNGTDTINILDASSTPLYNSRDTNVCINDSFSLTSSVRYANMHYLWNTGDTTLIIKQQKPGTYWVKADKGKCAITDTIKVKQANYFIHLNTRDTTICSHDNFRLKAASNASNIKWSTGEGGPSISITKSGMYYVRAGAGSCAVKDSAKVMIIKSPTRPFIGLDTAVCKGAKITLDAGVNAMHYRWNTGDSTRSILISDTGLYTVTVSDGNACKESASRRLNPINAYLSLGNDTTMCNGLPLLLIPHTNIIDLIWNTGLKTSSITVSKAGQYWVQGAKQGCVLSDTINVRLSYPPIVHLGKDTLICDSFDMVLDAGQGYSYQWYPGGETSRRIFIKKHGPYTVIVKNIYGCTGSDTIRILEDCDPTIFVPNAFHAFKDDPNEFFKAYGTYISYFEMKIYNRWGERLWQTENINNGWDGRYKGGLCEDGVYLYVIHYKGRYTNKQLTGTFHLLR